MIWRVSDIFFVAFHSSVIVFNLTGWIWKRTRKYNLILLLLTGLSWVVIGPIIGTPGYCPLTEWHFNILEHLGKTDLPDSYVKYLFDRITGLDSNPILIDRLTAFSFLAALVISIYLNARDLYGRKIRFRS